MCPTNPTSRFFHRNRSFERRGIFDSPAKNKDDSEAIVFIFGRTGQVRRNSEPKACGDVSEARKSSKGIRI